MKKIKGLILTLSSFAILASCSTNTQSSSDSAEPSSSQVVAKAQLYGLKITHAPNKTTYKEGETFDKTGMVITAMYDDLTNKEVTGYTITPSGPLTFDDKKVTITYTEGIITKSVTQDITVESASALASIAIKTPATKLQYSVGEKFDSMGMEVEATYGNGSKHLVMNYTIAPSGELTKDDTSITISYTEGEVTKTATQAITVIDAVLTGIEIKTAPTKLVYNLGDELDKTGMTVEGTYSNGKTEAITDFEVSPSGKLGINDTTLKVTAKGKSAYWKTKIRINAPEITESDYEDATELLFSDTSNYTLEGGATKSTWSSTEKNTFDRLRCNKDTNKKIIFEHDFSSLSDKTNAGFMSIMNNSRGGTKIEISTDNKETWRTLSEAKTEYNMIPADYKYPCKTIAGKAATDGANMNVYYCYYKLGSFLTSTTSKVFIRFSYEDPKDKGWVGIDTEGSDLIHSVTFYNKLNLSHALGEVKVKSISVKTMPTKTSYYVGERFEPTGMILNITWSDDTTSEISSGYTYDKTEGLTLEDTKVTISYQGMTADVAITVSRPLGDLTGIEITTNPTKTSYSSGETFDPAGMVVSALYGEDTKVVITEYTYSPNRALIVDDTEVIVSYGGKTASIAITVTKTKLEASDYTVAAELNFNDADSYTLIGGATKGATRKYKDGTDAIRLRCNKKSGAYIQVQYTYDTNLDLSKAGFMFTGLHTRLGTVVSMSTDGETFTNIIEPKEGDKVLPAEWEEFEDGITNSGATDKNMYRMYNHLAGLKGGDTVTIRFGYKEAPTGSVDGEGADIFRSVVFYSSLDLSNLTK